MIRLMIAAALAACAATAARAADAPPTTCPAWLLTGTPPACPTFAGAPFLDLEINPPAEDTYAYCRAIGGIGGAIRPSGKPGAPLHPLRCKPVPKPSPTP